MTLSTGCLAINGVTGELCAFTSAHHGRHSWEGLRRRVAVEAVNRSVKKGVEVKFVFGKLATDDIKQLVDLVGGVVALTITLESDQMKLPID